MTTTVVTPLADQYLDRTLKRVDEIIAAGRVYRCYDQPWLANRTRDASAVSIDRRIPVVLLKAQVNTTRPLAIHEISEAFAMNDGMPYLKAHKEVATPLERREVEREKPGAWLEYTRELDGYIKEVADEDIRHVMPDQDLRQFEEDDRALLKKILARERLGDAGPEDEPRDPHGRWSAGGAGRTQEFTKSSAAEGESYTPPSDWRDVEGQNPDVRNDEIRRSDHPGKWVRSGVIIREPEPDGRVWIVKGSGEMPYYGLPKGGIEEHLSPQANAIKEAYEETGLKVRITGHVGDFERPRSYSRYYSAERVGGRPTDFGWETERVLLVPPSEIGKYIKPGNERDALAKHLKSDTSKKHIGDAVVELFDRYDPTETTDLRDAYLGELDKRWRQLRRVVTDAIANKQLFAATAEAFYQGDPEKRFATFIDAAASRIVADADPVWALPYLGEAAKRGAARAGAYGAGWQVTASDACVLAGHELALIRYSTVRDASATLRDGLARRQTPAKISRTVGAVIKSGGQRRSRIMAAYMVVKSFNHGLLEALRSQGVTHVGVITEHPRIIRPIIRRNSAELGDAARKQPQKRHGKTGRFTPYAKKPSQYLIRKAERAKRLLEEYPEVDVVTAEDDRVCELCQDIADNGPYDIDTAQSLIPSHPWCRCTFSPVGIRSSSRDALDYDPNEPRDPHGRWAAAEGAAQTSVARGAAEAKARGVEPLKGSIGKHPMTISSRLVTAKKPEPGQDSHVDYLQAGYPAMRLDEDKLAKDVKVLKNDRYYPQLREDEVKGKSPDEIAEAFITMAASNIRRLHDEMPAEERNASKIWYDGAHLIADKDAKDYGYDDASVAGAYAALSPQTDWDENAYLGHQVVDIFTTKKSFPWNEEMARTAKRIWSSRKNQPLAALIEGKTLADLAAEHGDNAPTLQAMWVRTYNETYDKTRNYRVVLPDAERRLNLPDGTFGAWKENLDGTRPPARWRTVVSIENAIRSLGSHGDRKIISEAMGSRHKVRSFYNNILDPHSPNGDVTVDTHAVGAALLEPLGGTTVPVAHALGMGLDKKGKAKYPGFVAAGTNAQGVSGIYGLYAEAYRRVARDLNLEPRQLQSITWDYKRRLFSGKQKLLGGKIHEEWDKYHDKKQDLKTTQDRIFDLARKVRAGEAEDDADE